MSSRLPQLSKRWLPAPAADDATGWFALARDGVAVPTLDDARRCARGSGGDDPCRVRVTSMDPVHRTTIVAVGPSGEVEILVAVTPGLSDGPLPTLAVSAVDPNNPYAESLTATVVDPCRTQLRFAWPVPATEGEYTIVLSVDPSFEVVVTLDHQAPHEPPRVEPDPCAITLAPGTRKVGISTPCPPPEFPRPPLLTVSTAGCVLAAWSVHPRGWVLVPSGPDRVQLWQTCRGGVMAEIAPGSAVRDAIFWDDAIAVLGDEQVWLHDASGCPLQPTPLLTDLEDAVGLAISDEGWLVVIHRPGPNTGSTNVVVVRRDGTQVLEPGAFDGRGWYARHRNAALVFDEDACLYRVDPSKMSDGCCADPSRDLTEDEALFFSLVDDLPHLRERVAYPLSGEVIVGPAIPGDPLDAGRPGTQWHRIVALGEIPEGCAVEIETRAYDDIVAGDPLIPTGWSHAVTATAQSRTPINPPDDMRDAAADAAVLATPGRYLWVKLRLRSNGRATPRITEIEFEHPRRGIARLLPQVFQRSTPDDDFLRRWLALFETTVFDGVATRLDDYDALLDPRTAPPELLPFLADWLEILTLDRFRTDVGAFRRILAHANELANSRGTIDGLRLAVRLYMGISVHIVESFTNRAGFVLGCGTTIDGVTGPILGCQTTLSAEPSPVWLGDQPRLGCGFLLECEERTGTSGFHFDVWVAERDVCKSEDLALLRRIIELEKPAHTTYALHLFGAAGWVVGRTVLGEAVTEDFDRLDPTSDTYGLVVGNGPGRPKPLDHGFALGIDSRLHVEPGNPSFQITATVGATTRVGA